jgi:beta-lactam-binding protein with PASTA domain
MKTPHFIGLPLHQAMIHAAGQNLRLHIVSEKEHAHIEPGTILEQKPQPNSSIKEKQTVYIITARSPQEKNTPTILGLSSEEIAKISKQLRIKTKNHHIPSTGLPGRCIAQIPTPNQPIKDSKLIAYIAEEPSLFFILPNFTNQDLEEVISFLQKNNLTFSVYQKTNKLSPPYPKIARIVNQKPLIGSFIKLDQSTHIQLQIE